MHRNIVLWGTVTLLMLAFPAAGQDLNWNITGAGARAMGFGGAFIGIADDATSIVWNPGGLATLERPELSAVTSIAMNVFESDFYNPITDKRGGRKNDISHFVFNFTSIAYPIDLGERKLVLAAAYQRQLDFYTSRSEPRLSESKGGGDTFTPGLGLRLSPLLSVGAAANIWFGSADFERELSGGSIQVWDQTYSGLNFVIGTLFDFNNLAAPVPLKIGVSLRTPFDLEEEKTATGFAPEIKTYEMPLMVGFGVSYLIGESLTLAADYEMRAYGDSKIIDAQDNERSLGGAGEDLNQVRVGMEYLLVTDLGVFPIRGGFQTVPTVFTNYEETAILPTDPNPHFLPKDQVVGIGWALGSGYIAEQFAVDLTYTMQTYERENSSNALIGTFTVTSSAIIMSGIIYF